MMQVESSMVCEAFWKSLEYRARPCHIAMNM